MLLLIALNELINLIYKHKTQVQFFFVKKTGLKFQQI